MRNFLIVSFAAFAVIGAAGAYAPAAHADPVASSVSSAFNAPTDSSAANLLSGTLPDGTSAVAPTSVSSISSQAAASAAPASAGANLPTDANIGKDASAQFGTIMTWIMSLFAWLVGVAAITLDNAVYYTVVTMGGFVHNLTAVGVTWRILRDIGNIMLIFGFLAIGISIILDTERLGYGKKMLPMLLVAAVFLNFSLFFSEAIIDAGNLFATQFYTQINGGNPAQPTGYSIGAGSLSLGNNQVTNEPISNAIMGSLGLQTIYGDASTNHLALTGDHTWLIGFMGIILFMVTAFVLFSLAFILISRFVILIFLLIVAPVGFAGLAVPQLKGTASKWWGKLFEQTITAPILLLLLYIALTIITDANFLTGFNASSGGWLGFINNANLSGFAGVLLSFIVAMGLLASVVIFAKRLGAVGTGWATKAAGKLTFGATAWGMNRTVGRVAYHTQRLARQSKTFNKLNAATGRVMTRGLDRAATGSFDIRGTGVLKNLPFGGIDAGAAQKGGFTEARAKNIKSHEEEVKRIETAHKEGFNDRDEKKAIAKATAEAEGKNRAAKQIYGEVKPVLEKKIEEQKAVVAQHEQQVAQLEAEEQQRTKFGVSATPEDLQKLASARENLTTSKASLATSEAKLGEATQNLSESAENLKKVTEEAQKTAGANALKANIKDSKTEYAEGLTSMVGKVVGLAAYGPGVAAAAKKLKESLKEKPTKDKFLEMAQKMAKELEETEKKNEGSGSEEKKEEKKPEEQAH